jgi:nucleoside-diphosphate-sugar epimerase
MKSPSTFIPPRTRAELASPAPRGRQFDVTINVLDIQQARSILGWAPKLEFSAGMDLMISDYRAGRSNYSTLLSARDTEGDRKWRIVHE